MMMRQFRKIRVMLFLAVLACALPGWATDLYWNIAAPSSGYVSEFNWADVAGNGVFGTPGEGDTAYFRNTGVANVDATHLFGGTLGQLIVGDGTTGEHFTPSDGHVVQAGGDVAVSGSIFVGNNGAPNTSSYDLQSGSLTVGGWSAVGNLNSAGSMTIGQTGSTAAASFSAPNFFVGFQGGVTSSLTMEGVGSASTNMGIMIGRNYSGTGTCTGTLTMRDNTVLDSSTAVRGNGNLTFNVGYGAGSTGTMIMEDSASATIANWDALIGHAGATGTLSMTDSTQMSITTISEVEGENTYNGLAQVGLGYGGTTGSSGTIDLSGTASLSYDTALSVLLGAWGSADATPSTATVNISGGTSPLSTGAVLSSVKTMTFGVGTNSQAYLNISEYGSLAVSENAGTDIAAYLGTAEAVIEGHGNLSTGYINLGSQYGSDGTLTVRDSATVNVTNGPGYFTFNVGTWQGTGELIVEDDAAITVSGAMLIGNQGDANSSTYSTGTLTMSGGTIEANNVYMGVNGYGNATVTMTGGSITSYGATALARGGPNCVGTMTMSGDASWSSTNSWLAVGNGYGGGGYGEAWTSDSATISSAGDILIGWGGTGILHVGDGTETDSVVVTAGGRIQTGNGDAQEDSNARIDLNAGGTLRTGGFYSAHGADNPYTTEDESLPGVVSVIINFDGGTLQATASDIPAGTDPMVPFLSNDEWLKVNQDGGTAETYNAFWYGGAQDFQLNVMEGGAVIDTNGFEISVTEAFLAGEAGDGGLTKIGLGKLTLTSDSSTYTGDTTIENGTLSITNNTVFDDASSLYIDVDGILDLDFDSTGGVYETVAGLYFDDVAQVEGLWGAIGNTEADFVSAYLTGTGLLSVGYVTPIPGDTNGNKIVDDVDAANMATYWGGSVTPGDYSKGDFNGDGVVDMKDASILAANWGDHTSSESTSAVPEPSILILLLGLVPAALLRRARSW